MLIAAPRMPKKVSMRIAFALAGFAVLAVGLVMIRRPREVTRFELQVNRRLLAFFRFRPDLKPPDVFGWLMIFIGAFDIFVTVAQPLISRG